MEDQARGLVPARYVGTNKIHRNKLQGPGFDANGQRRTTLQIEYGDVLMMPEREIVGQTYLFDVHNVLPPKDMGAGKRVKPEHAKLNDEELAALGYEFHGGRPDFELVVPSPIAEDTKAQKTPDAVSAKNGG